MTGARIAELRRFILDAGSGLIEAGTNPWQLLEEALDGLEVLAEFVESARQPVGDLTEAFEELERQQAKAAKG